MASGSWVSPRPGRLCRGLEAVGSLSRCEQEGGSCFGRRVQPPDAELGSPVPAACQLGLQKHQESLGRGLLLRSCRQPSQRGPFCFLQPVSPFPEKVAHLSQNKCSFCCSSALPLALPSSPRPFSVPLSAWHEGGRWRERG